MSKIKLMETSVPVDLVTNLKVKGYDFVPAWAYKLYDTIFKAQADLLAIIKRKDQPAAIVIKDVAGNFVMGSIVKFHAADDSDEEVGGNWSFEMTLDPEDIKPEYNIMNIGDKQYQTIFATDGAQLYNLKITDSLYIVEYTVIAINTLFDNLRVNAKEGEVYEIEEEGYFIASSTVENGEVVLAVTPGDKLKTLIKDDTAGEV